MEEFAIMNTPEGEIYNTNLLQRLVYELVWGGVRDWVGAVWNCVMGMFLGAITYCEVAQGTGENSFTQNP